MIEREAKLGAAPSFVVPDLSGVVPGVLVEPGAVRHLDATYYDGPARPLAEIGATVRYRTGEGDGKWTVKLGGSAEGGVLARDEIDVAAPPDPVPDEVSALVAEHLGGAGALAPVARLVTDRTTLVVRSSTGQALAEIDDDLVHVLDGDREIASFREVEVELAVDTPDAVLETIVARLRAAGAGEPDPTPKLVRALRLVDGEGSAR